MPTPVVWTERRAGPWTQCTYCAVLMALVAAGKTSYPGGIYTDAERDALERSDDQPDGQGATFNDTDVAIRRRYSITMLGAGQRMTSATLRDLLATPGHAIALAGLNSALPSGVVNWDPGFRGAHAVGIVSQGGGKVLWLDPLATAKYAGDRPSVDSVVQWASALNGNSHDPRWLTVDQLAPRKDADVEILGTFERTVYGQWLPLTEAGNLHTEPTAASPTLQTYGAGTAVQGTMLVSNEGAQWVVAILYVTGKGYCLGYLHEKAFGGPR